MIIQLNCLGILTEINLISSVLSKFVGPVGQSDISYECPTKNIRVSDQMSNRKYKNIRFGGRKEAKHK